MRALPSASIVMCTYRGERFLAEQLESLRAQTAPPAEVIAQDDGSDDGTMGILERFTESWPALRIFRNERRLGFASNFASAIRRATGDVIFPCDQDDVWHPRKLERMLGVFAADDALALAYCDASLVDENGRELEPSLIARNNLETSLSFGRLLRSNPLPGICLAFRSSLRADLTPFPPGWEHDYWALAVATGLGRKLASVPEPLVHYRQHVGQVIGGDTRLAARWRRARGKGLGAVALEADRFGALAERLAQRGASAECLRQAAEKQAWLRDRAKMPGSRAARIMPIFRALLAGHYSRYEAGLSTAVKDWLAPI